MSEPLRLPTATNYRGDAVGVWLGIAFTGAVILGALAVTLVTLSVHGSLTQWGRRLLWIDAGVLVVFLAGLYDDYRPARARGLVRQVRALFAGELTSGIVKLVVIVLAAALVVWALGARGLAFALGVPVVAASANFWNLLDVVPGRALKYFLPVTLALAIADGHAAFATIAAAGLGAGAVALLFDLRERAMLGDAGSNVLGFIVGIGLVMALPVPGLAAVLVALVAIHVAAETVTLSRLIRSAPPLQWFDRLGRIPFDPPAR
jgi:UDP-GlcNAc:undecaprenyl-phosphate GlcNAc-1-phosphate transferase